MEQAHLEVVLSAINRGEGVMKSFGQQLQQITKAVEQLGEAPARAAAAAESGFQKMVNSAKAAGQQMESSFRTVAGHGSMLGGALARVGQIAGAMWSSPIGALGGFVSLALSGLGNVLGAVAHLAGEVAHLGLQIVEWLGTQALSVVEKLGKALLGIGAGVVAAGGALGIAGVREAANLEDYTLQLSVLMGSMQAAESEIERLRALTRTIPFHMEELVEADKMMRVFNIDLGGTAKTLTLFADVAKAYGVSLDQVISVYGRLQAGMFSQRLMMSVGLTMPRMEAAGAKFSGAGKVEGEAAGRPEMLTAAALKVWLPVAGMAERAMQGLHGRMTNLSDAWALFKDLIGKTELPGAKAAVDALAGALDALGKPVAALYQSLADAFGPVLAQGLEMAKGLVERFGATINEIAKSDAWKGFLGTLAEVFARAQATIGGWLDWLRSHWKEAWDFVAGKVSAAAEWIAGAVGGIAAVIEHLVDSKQSLFEWGRSLVQMAIHAGQGLAQGIIRGFGEVLDFAATWLPRILAIVGAVWGSTIAGPFGAVAGAGLGMGIGGDIVKGMRHAVPAALERVQGWEKQGMEWWDKTRQAETGAGSFLGDVSDAFQKGWQSGTAWLQGFRGSAATRAGAMGAPVFSAAAPGGGGDPIAFSMFGKTVAGYMMKPVDAQIEAAKKSSAAADLWAGLADTMANVLDPNKSPFAVGAKMFEAMGAPGLAAQDWAKEVVRLDDVLNKVWPLASTGDIGAMAAFTKGTEERNAAMAKVTELSPSEHAARDLVAAAAAPERAAWEATTATPMFTQAGGFVQGGGDVNLTVNIDRSTDPEEVRRIAHEVLDKGLDDAWAAEASASGYPGS